MRFDISGERSRQNAQQSETALAEKKRIALLSKHLLPLTHTGRAARPPPPLAESTGTGVQWRSLQVNGVRGIARGVCAHAWRGAEAAPPPLTQR